MGKIKKVKWFPLVLSSGWFVTFVHAVLGREADWRFVSACASLVLAVYLAFLALMPLFRADDELER